MVQLIRHKLRIGLKEESFFILLNLDYLHYCQKKLHRKTHC